MKPAAVKAAASFLLKRIGLAATGGWGLITAFLLDIVYKKISEWIVKTVDKYKLNREIDRSAEAMNEATNETERDDAFDNLR